MRIARELKGFHAMRLEIMTPPDVAHRRLADPQALGQTAAAPLASALGLGLQLDCKVVSMTCWIFSGPWVAFRPRPGDTSHSPGKPFWAKRARHSLTVGRLLFSCCAMALSDCPSAAASTIRQRRATCWGVP